MKKMLFCTIIVSLILGIIICLKNRKKNECHPITGGGFTLIFDTNGGNKIESIHVCVACSPDSYDKLPTPIRDGYRFDGWYYDKDFKDAVIGTSTLDIRHNTITSKKEWCIIGYKDVTIYAKWV